MDKQKNTISSKNFSELKFILMMIVAVVSWAFAFPFIKIGLSELSFINLTIMRFFIQQKQQQKKQNFQGFVL